MSRLASVLRLSLLIIVIAFTGGCDSDHPEYSPFWMDVTMQTSTEVPVMVLRGDGSFLLADPASSEGRIDDVRLARLRALFTEERIAIYREDVLGTDGNLPDATDRAPRFRLVIRAEVGVDDDGQKRFDSQRLEGYFREPESTRAETREMLAELAALFRDAR